MRFFLTILFCISIFFYGLGEEKKSILDILRDKQIITPAEYEEYKDEMDGTAEMNSARRAKDTTVAFKPRVEFHVMAQFAYAFNDARYLDVNNSFEMVRACVYGGAYLTRNIDFFTLYYFQPSAISKVHELFARWRIVPEFGVRVGLMKNPLTFENNVSTLVLHTIDYSQAVASLAGVSTDVIGLSSGRDAGAEVFGSLFNMGDFRLLDYRLGVFNGAGIQYLKDNNNHKDISGSITLQPLKGNYISGGFYIGKGHYVAAGDSVAGDYTRNRWTVGVLHDSKYFYARAEYLRGLDGLTKRHGFYVLGIYRPLPQLDLTLVYDWYNDDISCRNTNDLVSDIKEAGWYDASRGRDRAVSIKYSIGATYRFTKRTRVQAFYMFTQHDALSLYTDNSHKAIVQLELGF